MQVGGHYHYTIICQLQYKFSHTLCKRRTDCGICGVITPMFWGMKHILASLQCE